MTEIALRTEGPTVAHPGSKALTADVFSILAANFERPHVGAVMAHRCFTAFIVGLLATVTGLCDPALALGATPDLSGTWVLAHRESVSGTDYANGIPDEITVALSNTSITLSRVIPGENGASERASERASETLAVGGEPTESRTEKGNLRSATVQWTAQREGFTERATYRPAEGDGHVQSETTEVWSLSKAGTTLTLLKTQRGLDGDSYDGNKNWSMRGVYERERLLAADAPGANGIQFERGLTWPQILTKAKAEKKYVFVDAVATGDKSCEAMDNDVYRNPRVGNIVSGRFIAAKAQVGTIKEDREPVKNGYTDLLGFIDQNRVTEFPTFLFLSPDGDIVHRGAGCKKAYEFIELLEAALNPEKQYYTLVRNYEIGTKNYDAMPYLVSETRSLGEKELARAVALDYIDHKLARLTDEQLLNRNTINLMGRYVRGSRDRIFALCYHNPAKIDEVMRSRGYAQGIVDMTIDKEDIQPKLWRAKGVPITNTPDWDMISASVTDRYDAGYAERGVLNAKIAWYQGRKEWPEAARYNLEKLDKYGADLNGFGWVFVNNKIWDIFEHVNDRDILERAAQWELKVVKAVDTSADPYDTYANLLYKLGRGQDAIEWEKKGFELEAASAAKENRSPNKVFEETLGTMLKGTPTWSVN